MSQNEVKELHAKWDKINQDKRKSEQQLYSGETHSFQYMNRLKKYWNLIQDERIKQGLKWQKIKFIDINLLKKEINYIQYLNSYLKELTTGTETTTIYAWINNVNAAHRAAQYTKYCQANPIHSKQLEQHMASQKQVEEDVALYLQGKIDITEYKTRHPQCP